MDFTFVCPTEIAEFGKRNGDFKDRDAQVLGASTDTHFVHLAWRNNHPDLKDLPFPMLADTKRELSTALGILHKQDGVPLRATFIVDPRGHHPLRQRQRPVGRPQRRRGAARARRAADRRALPLQLEEGRRRRWRRPSHEPRSTSSATRCPRRRKDIKLNLQARAAGRHRSTPAQRWGVAIASAIAARNPQLRDGRARRRARAEVGRGGDRGRPGRGGADGDEQRLLPLPPHGRQASVRARSRRACA